MMKLLIKISVVLLAVIVLCYFIPINTTQQATIKGSFFDVANEVNTADNWKNWYAPLKDSYKTKPLGYSLKQDYKNHRFYINTPNQQYQVNSLSPASLELVTGKTMKTTQALRFFFDKDGKVIIAETESTSALNYLLNWFKADRQYHSIIHSLKPFMEDPALYYGFDIKKTAVPDTAYLISTKSIAKKDRFKIMESAYNSLRSFAKKNKVDVLGKPYLSYSNLNADSIQLTTMLVTNKELIIDYESPITFFTMPKNGNMLFAHYQGSYGKSASVYNALEKYVTHNNLNRVYQPFERYRDGKIPQSDESMVDMDVFFPIY